MENIPLKKRILLVDDDPIALRIYRDGLTRQGFDVKTATDGLTALQALRVSKPELVVLDLMMPRFSGVEVLKFIRGEKELAALPVIVLSNAYMDPLAQDAAALGAQKGLLKIKCNPASLAAAINELLAGQPGPHGIDHLLAASKAEPTPTNPPSAVPTSHPVAQAAAWKAKPLAQPIQPRQPPEPKSPAGDPREQARQELLGNTQAICTSLRQLLEAFQTAPTQKDRELRLHDLSRKVHFVAAIAGIAEYYAIAQMASAFEALLFSVMDKLPNLEPSLERTSTMAVEFLESLLTSPPELRPGPPPHPLALVVDDDRLSNRLVISALRNAQLQCRGTESPEIALRWLQEKHYDLVLLDIEMPGMDGIELCKRLRRLPGYEKTPIIYVTLHSDFETLAKSVVSGADDLIPKPILATELAVKAVMHLLKNQLGRPKW
jgi:CheY-like chemotaxis protein